MVISSRTSSGPERKPLVSVVVPTLNEERNLPQLFASIPDIVDEVILVDGFSKDRTVALAKELRPDIIVVYQTRRGKGNALCQGFEAANGDIIVMLDADGSTSPSEIPSYVGTLLAGADFAKGSRFMQGGGTSDMEFHRYLGNQFFVWAVRILFGGSYTDLCYGYNAFWAWTLPLLNLDGDGFEIETMMNVRAIQAGLRVAEVPSFENRRFMGLSNLRAFPDGWRVLRTIIKEWRNYPRLRMVRNHESSVDSESFEKSFHGILEDTNQFVKMTKHLAKDKLKTVAEKLLSRYDALMSTDMGEASRSLQKRYAEYYRAVYKSYLMKHIPDTENTDADVSSTASKNKTVAGKPNPTS
ncbi:MAG: glycosyltransferase family 2 protein [Anaerolineales bacterium]